MKTKTKILVVTIVLAFGALFAARDALWCKAVVGLSLDTTTAPLLHCPGPEKLGGAVSFGE